MSKQTEAQKIATELEVFATWRDDFTGTLSRAAAELRRLDAEVDHLNGIIDIQAVAQKALVFRITELEQANKELLQMLKDCIADAEYVGADGWMTGSMHSNEYNAAIAAIAKHGGSQ